MNNFGLDCIMLYCLNAEVHSGKKCYFTFSFANLWVWQSFYGCFYFCRILYPRLKSINQSIDQLHRLVNQSTVMQICTCGNSYWEFTLISQWLCRVQQMFPFLIPLTKLGVVVCLSNQGKQQPMRTTPSEQIWDVKVWNRLIRKMKRMWPSTFF